MKLPIFQPANTALPASSGGARRAGGAAVDPTGAGLAQIGSDLMQAGRQFGAIGAQQAREQEAEDARAERLRAAAEKAKQAQLDDIDATTALNTTQHEMDLLENELQRGTRDPDTDEPITLPVGPREYMTEHEKRANVVRNRLLSQERTPGAEFQVRKGAERIFGQRRADAFKYSDTLAVDKYRSAFQQNREDMERRIATEANPERAAALEEELAGMFKRAQGMIPLKELQVEARQSEERIDTAKARLQAEVDPGGVIAALRGPAKDSPYRLAPDKATALADHFEKEWSQQQREAVAQAKRDEEAQHKIRKDNEDDAIGMLTRWATNGQLTTATLDSWAETLRLDAGPFNMLHKIVTDPPKDAPSDGPTYNRLLIAISTEDPDFYRGDPQAKLARFAAPGGGINPKDYGELSQRVRAIVNSRRSLEEHQARMAQSTADRAESRANRLSQQQIAEQQRATSKAHYDYNEGMKYAQSQLGVKDPFALDDKKGKLWGQFVDEAYVRLHPSNGVRGEDVKTIIRDELVPRYRTLMGEQAQQDLGELYGRLRFKPGLPGPGQFPPHTDMAAHLTAAQARYNLPPEQYKQQLDLLGLYKEKLDEKKRLQDAETAKPKTGRGPQRAPSRPD